MNVKIKDIQETQQTIDLLLKLGSLSADSKEDSKWVLEPLYHNHHCSIGIVHIKKQKMGACDPHIHYEAKEYLICISGAFLLNVNGNYVRTVREGECAVINPGELHYSKPVLNDTKIAYICIPADSGMDELAEKLKEGSWKK